MRAFFLLMFLIIMVFDTKAQIKKIFGYVQEVNGGTIQTDVAPANALNTEEKASTGARRYFLFAAIKKKHIISIVQVWIEGKQYAFKKDTLTKLPYILQSSNGTEKTFIDTLVKTSQDMIIQLRDLIKIEQETIPENIKKAVSENNIVITFMCRNRLLYATLKDMTRLTTVFAQ